MNILIPIIITSIAGLSTILGNILLFIDVKYKDKLISFCLGLAFIVMFLISILELIPEGIRLVYGRFSIFNIFIFCFILLMFGYIVVYVIEKNIKNEDSLYKIGILSMISLFIHNVPEGIICAITSSNELELGIKMAFIIMIHNIPEGICISLPVYYSTGSRGKAFFMTIVSSLGEIFGAIITVLFLNNIINDIMLSVIYIITAGIMITLSTIKIFKEGISLKVYRSFILGVLIGILIIYLTL